MQDLLRVARRLDYMIGQITPDEYAWQDANYDRDSVLGRELLFLVANDSWIRATSEIIDIARSDAIETAIDIDVDLSHIVHEAFRDRPGQIWLPIVVLPPLRQRLPDPEPFSTLTVTDGGGVPLMTLPRTDVRHRLAAALTEIIVNVAVARLPDVSGQTSSPGRDHRLVLSAAIYRLLRDETVPAPLLDGDGPMREVPAEPMGRIDRARHEIGTLLATFAGLLTAPIPPDQVNMLSARQLTERAIRVLNAVTKSATIVIPADREQPPAVLTVRLPGRALHLAPAKWADVFGLHATPHRRWRRSGSWRRHLRFSNWIFPSASLHLDLLLPSANADRHVRVNLPDGISPDPSRPLARRADLDIRCEQPQSTRQLKAVASHLLDPDLGWPAPLQQSVADLALAKADAVQTTLRDHHAAASVGEPPLGPGSATRITREFRHRQQTLSSALHQIAVRGPGDPARAALVEAWAGGGWLALPIGRRTSTDTISPGVVAARARAIDDIAQRSVTSSARMEVRIAVTDSAYYTAARLSGWINVLLMSVVLGFFWFGHLDHGFRHTEQQASAEVLALILTLFSAIQLGRIERNDRSTMRGVLVPAGNPLIVAAILPIVVLAVALAFSRSFAWAERWTAGCISVQLAGQGLTWYRQRRLLERGNPAEELTADLLPDAPAPEPDLLFYTDAPDYAHDLVLHSGWWRTTTAEALMMGRAARGYVIWQHDDQRALDALLASARPASQPTSRSYTRWLHRHARAEQQDPVPSAPADHEARSPLEQAASVLALQRSGTAAQSLNFAVFRDEPDARSGWVSEHAIPVPLRPILLTLGVDATLDLFLGLPPRLYARISEHPVTSALNLATRHGLATCETQLPIPAPDYSYADLQWARIELNTRPEDLGHIHLFLTDLLALTDTAIVGVRTRRDGIPRIINPRPRSTPATAREAADRARLALATDLDIVARSAVTHENPADPNWRLLAICADWQIGNESRLLAGLDHELALIGLTSTVLYGQSVLLLLGHANPARGQRDSAELRSSIFFDKRQSRTELGTAQPHPLLRVHMRTPDRPGATVGVLDSLREAIRHEFPTALAHGDLSVWHARAEVKDGTMAHVQLTIMLPTPADHDPSPARTWTAGDLWRIERRALSLLTTKMADSNHSATFPVSDAEIPPDTTIQLGLIRMPDLSSEPSGTLVQGLA